MKIHQYGEYIRIRYLPPSSDGKMRKAYVPYAKFSAKWLSKISSKGFTIPHISYFTNGISLFDEDKIEKCNKILCDFNWSVYLQGRVSED